MIVSFNEIENICYRAGLGVGLTQGQAEDAGRIGVRLARRQPDGLEIMLRALQSIDTNPLGEPPFRLETGCWRPARPVLPALIAVPVVLDLQRAEPGVLVDLGAIDEPDVLVAAGEIDDGRPMAPRDVPDILWRELAKLAARTYVPATATSRRTGAGAGVIDND
jgi:hypothetical protein